jgi:hypothetical protein
MYWDLALRTAFHLRNRLPSPDASGGSGGIPYIVLHGAPANPSHLKVFVYSAYLCLEDHNIGKLSPNALRSMFIGNCGDGLSYR